MGSHEARGRRRGTAALLADFLDGELSDFADQMDKLTEMIGAEQRWRMSASKGYVPR